MIWRSSHFHKAKLKTDCWIVVTATEDFTAVRKVRQATAGEKFIIFFQICTFFLISLK